MGKAQIHKKPKFSNHQSRKWVPVRKIMDGEPVNWWYDKTFGRSMYFEHQERWYVIPIVQEFYWDSLKEGEELSTVGVRIKTSIFY